VGALCGLALGTKLTSSSGEELILGIPRFVGVASLMIFGLLLAMSPVLAGSSQAAAVFSGFFRAGSLVFGGGHVVLPLLESETVTRGWIGAEEFLAGYGAAQALPGPLFAFSAYLGFKLEPEPNELTGAVLAMSGLFLPGFLLVIGVLPFWDRLRSSPQAQSAMRGANASVVGILGAALYSPILTTAASDMREFALGLAGFAVLQAWKMPPLAVVICLVAARMALDPFV
jgi:chromate transporter